MYTVPAPDDRFEKRKKKQSRTQQTRICFNPINPLLLYKLKYYFRTEFIAIPIELVVFTNERSKKRKLDAEDDGIGKIWPIIDIDIPPNKYLNCSIQPCTAGHCRLMSVTRSLWEQTTGLPCRLSEPYVGLLTRLPHLRSRSLVSCVSEDARGPAVKYWDTGSGGKPSSPPRSRDRQRDYRL